jgi:signal transduction histidine kinase/ligand-binding sensor domain-containing protein/CheY-like chemotaxis protein
MSYFNFLSRKRYYSNTYTNLKYFDQHITHYKRYLAFWMLVFLGCLPYFLSGQELRLARQMVPKEITKKATGDLLEDSYGFIWMAGRNLYKYDGYQTRAYLPEGDNPSGYKALIEDSRGNIWIGAARGLFRYDRKTDKLIQCFGDKIKSRTGDALNIYALYEDQYGNIWVGGENRIFVIRDQKGEHIELIEGWVEEMDNQVRSGVRCLVADQQGNMYTGTSSGLWQIGEKFALTLYLPDNFNEANSFFVSGIEQGKADTLWLATSAGLWVFESDTKRFSQIKLPGDPDQAVRKVLVDDQDKTWVGRSDGVLVLLPNGEYEAYMEAPFHFPRALLRDRFGNLWVGKGSGVHVLSYDRNKKFPVFQIESKSRYQDNFFFFTAQDSTGGFWFRLLRTGLGYCASLNSELEVRLQPPNHFFIEEIKSFCTDPEGHVWVITFTNGLYFFEHGQRQYRQIDLSDSLKMARPLIILSDREDGSLLWISTKFGLCAINRFTLKAQWYHPNDDLPWLGTDALSYIEQAADGNIWGAVRTSGNRTVVSFDKRKKKFVTGLTLPHSLDKESGYDMKRVPGDQIWIGEKGGLTIIDTKQKTGMLITPFEGLPTSSVGSIVTDKHGNIWYSSGQSICKYDGLDFTCYQVGNEIGGFVAHSSTLTKEGKVVFGASNGLLIINPDEVEKDTLPPKVILSNFQVFNEGRQLETAYELVKEIRLPFEDNILSFTFSALHFNHPELTKFRYKLDGFEKDWVQTSSRERQATYTNLSPGAYTFRATAANIDGYWTPKQDELQVKLIILPPWYRTWWAYALWVGLFLGSIYGLYRFQLNRRLALAEARRLMELDLVKTRLYNNITHEFRTPLTIILGMVDQIKKDPKNWFNEGAKLIRRNAKQLLSLVNQLLDLSKLESGHMPLNLINGDIILFLEYIVESFHSYADSKDIRMHFITDRSELWMDYDPEKLHNVVSNLISNSIKFTPPGGNVYVDIRLENHQAKNISLQIRDDGIGIDPEHLPYIFDRFYQVDPDSYRDNPRSKESPNWITSAPAKGTGIGLALSKELVHNMNGTIEAKSTRKKGTQITIILPLSQEAEKMKGDRFQKTTSVLANALYIPHEEKTEFPEVIHSDRYLVLLVEDNADILFYLNSFLSNNYQIVTAQNGQEGIDKAIDLIPDLIVSDVMMPKKDGYELCATLKTDDRTNHIPIILLTAKTDQVSKLEGLVQGADAYLAKPFHQQELLVRIEKLIDLRQKMQQRFQKKGTLFQSLKNPKKNKQEIFLQKVLEIIEKNLKDENFGMPQLCKELYMGRTNLFRKLKAITGKSATHLIRSLRLEKAKSLLENTHMNINEVCMEVGFNNPGYFSRVFKDEFGMTPTEVRNNRS